MIGMPRQKILGFSMIEILVVISIFLILSAISIPNYAQYTANNRAQGYATEIMISLKVARSTAVTEHKDVTICAISNGAPGLTCNTSATQWLKGWYVYSGSTVYKVVQFRSGAQSIDSGISVSTGSSLTFSEDGLPTPANYVITITPPSCTTGYTITAGSGGIIKRAAISC